MRYRRIRSRTETPINAIGTMFTSVVLIDLKMVSSLTNWNCRKYASPSRTKAAAHNVVSDLNALRSNNLAAYIRRRVPKFADGLLVGCKVSTRLSMISSHLRSYIVRYSIQEILKLVMSIHRSLVFTRRKKIVRSAFSTNQN